MTARLPRQEEEPTPFYFSTTGGWRQALRAKGTLLGNHFQAVGNALRGVPLVRRNATEGVPYRSGNHFLVQASDARAGAFTSGGTAFADGPYEIATIANVGVEVGVANAE